MHRCSKCDNPISAERIKAYLDLFGRLPDTCTEHSDVKKNGAFMVYGHKTAGEVVVVENKGDNLRQAQRAYKRSR